ncbi:hypothetical protein OJ998_22175 [Solirubrobacter taibaiensis]|nr:hypothetical protein [Solirubrobacter taibaiensis]
MGAASVTTRRAVIAVLGVLVGIYAVLFIAALTPSADGGGFAPVLGLHVSVMILAFIALAIALKDIQSNAALDEQARSLWLVAMACALPLAAIAYVVVCARRGAQGHAN